MQYELVSYIIHDESQQHYTTVAKKLGRVGLASDSNRNDDYILINDHSVQDYPNRGTKKKFKEKIEAFCDSALFNAPNVMFYRRVDSSR